MRGFTKDPQDRPPSRHNRVRVRIKLAFRWALLAYLFLKVPSAYADDLSDTFARANATLSRGALSEAIETYESVADRGVHHPDISYNRGVAYLTRVRNGEGKPGDLGRAAAAMEETLLLRPADHDAHDALESIRSEVARKRAREGNASELANNTSAWQAIVNLLPEQLWAICALASSMVLTLGLLLRRMRSLRMHIAGGITAIFGLLALLATAPMAGLADYLRHNTSLGVIVAPEARFLDDKGIPTSLPPVPEAASVEVLERRGSLVRIRWGQTTGLTTATNVRIVRNAQEG